MSRQVIIVFALTFVIHLIGTLSYALRLAGARTGKVAVSFALFNVLALVSRTSHTFQGPLLAKHVEGNILRGEAASAAAVRADFHWLILAATLATAAGAALIPTFRRLFEGAIGAFAAHRSVPRLLLGALTPAGLRGLRESAALPRVRGGLMSLSLRHSPLKIVVFNVVVTALITVGSFASLYAGCLNPQLRVTANNLSPVINGLSTILLFVYVDPYLSLLTDDVTAGRATMEQFRGCVMLMVISRLAGTALAQLILVPAARLVILVAELL